MGHKDHRLFVLKFKPAFAVMYGNWPGQAFTETLQYSRAAYFPAQGFFDFTILRRESTN